MGKLLIAGHSGFIGKHFLGRYRDQFDEIFVYQSRHELVDGLKSSDEISKSPLNCDITAAIYLIHDKFDACNNLKIFKNFLRFCKSRKIPKIIFVSSFVVYDFERYSNVSENTPYSKSKDLYIQTKQKMERLAEGFLDDLSVCIVHPTIVTGDGGNWSRVFSQLKYCPKVVMPNNGRNICNAVNVNSVCEFLFKKIYDDRNLRFEKCIVNGEADKSWKEYIGLDAEQVLDSNKNRFHDSFLQNAIICGLNLIPNFWLKSNLNKLLNWLANKGQNCHEDRISSWQAVSLTRMVMRANYRVTGFR
jgi:nucleoside-diphosphate-sugar epimerase